MGWLDFLKNNVVPVGAGVAAGVASENPAVGLGAYGATKGLIGVSGIRAPGGSNSPLDLLAGDPYAQERKQSMAKAGADVGALSDKLLAGRQSSMDAQLAPYRNMIGPEMYRLFGTDPFQGDVKLFGGAPKAPTPTADAVIRQTPDQQAIAAGATPDQTHNGYYDNAHDWHGASQGTHSGYYAPGGKWQDATDGSDYRKRGYQSYEQAVNAEKLGWTPEEAKMGRSFTPDEKAAYDSKRAHSRSVVS